MIDLVSKITSLRLIVEDISQWKGDLGFEVLLILVSECIEPGFVEDLGGHDEKVHSRCLEMRVYITCYCIL